MIDLIFIFLAILLIIPIVLFVEFFKKRENYTFKGGLIGLIISFIYTLFSFWDPGCPLNTCTFLKKSFLWIIHLIYEECMFFTQCSGEGCIGCALIGAPVLAFIQFTLVGFLIGWIIKKIKPKKSS